MSDKPRKPGSFGPGNKAAAKAEHRVRWAGRLPPEVVAKLREQAGPGLSQADIVSALVLRWDTDIEPIEGRKARSLRS